MIKRDEEENIIKIAKEEESDKKRKGKSENKRGKRK